jgi:predicted TIM-barrel fold metal-dependent hydrolase
MSSATLISSDSHIIEPADLWKNIETRFRDQAPRLVHEGPCDQWYVAGVKFGSIGINQQAGVRFDAPEKLTEGGRMDTVRLGGLDPHAHVKDMDADSVAGGVLYPSQGLHLYRAVRDSALLCGIFRAYNDWLRAFCSPYPDRLKGVAMINVDDVDDAVSELHRAGSLGLAGAMIPVTPMARRYDDPCYDPLWAAAQDLALPLSLHVGTYRWRPDSDFESSIREKDPVEFSCRDYDPRKAIAAMIFGGVFERYPKLKVGAVEFDVAWAPHFIARMDYIYNEHAVGFKHRRFRNGAVPSDFFRNNVFLSFQEDAIGIDLRSHVGTDSLMWGSDYPHAESTFPKSLEIVERILKDVPEEEKTKITRTNAATLYGFN